LPPERYLPPERLRPLNQRGFAQYLPLERRPLERLLQTDQRIGRLKLFRLQQAFHLSQSA
jgi:hypothetical protein